MSGLDQFERWRLTKSLRPEDTRDALFELQRILDNMQHRIERSPGNAGLVNVLEEGAKGDGVTDDTNAIQGAIDKKKAGIVFFPKGTYCISDTITLPQAGFRILGDGTRATTIKALSTFPAGSPMVQLGNGQGRRASVRVDDVTLDCADVAEIGVRAEGIQEFAGAQRVDVVGFTKKGFYVTFADTADVPSSNYLLQDIRVALSATPGADPIGVHLENGSVVAEQGYSCGVIRCTCDGPTGASANYRGIVVTEGRGTVLKNIHTESTVAGIDIEANSAATTVDGFRGNNDVTDCIRLSDGRGLVCSGVLRTGATNAINDIVNGVTLTDDVVTLYVSPDFPPKGSFAPKYMTATLSASQTANLAAGDHVEFDTTLEDSGHITLSTGTGQDNGIFTLPEGAWLVRLGSLRANFSSSSGVLNLRFRDGSGTALGPGSAGVRPPSSTSDQGAAELTETIMVVGSAGETVELRIESQTDLSDISPFTGVTISALA